MKNKAPQVDYNRQHNHRYEYEQRTIKTKTIENCVSNYLSVSCFSVLVNGFSRYALLLDEMFLARLTTANPGFSLASLRSLLVVGSALDFSRLRVGEPEPVVDFLLRVGEPVLTKVEPDPMEP